VPAITDRSVTVYQMRIGLLRCDDIFTDLRPEYGGYHQLFTNLFATADANVTTTADGIVEPLEFVDVPVYLGTFPSAPDDYDAWLITGSARGVYEDEPWIRSLLDLVRDLDAARAPTLGVCFGHQAIAQALGGRVERVDTWGIGNRPARISRRESWMTPGHDEVGIFYCHHDQVLDLPTGSRVVATADHCPVAALAVGDHMLGVQAHPEFDPHYADVLYRGRYTGTHPEALLDDALSTLDDPLHRIDVATWMLRFIRGC